MELCQDNVSRLRIIVSPFLVSEYCPFDYFFTVFPQSSGMPHNAVTVWDIFMQLFRKEYLDKRMCRIQEWSFFLYKFLSYAPMVIVKRIFIETLYECVICHDEVTYNCCCFPFLFSEMWTFEYFVKFSYLYTP